jgi:hypothetical protein
MYQKSTQTKFGLTFFASSLNLSDTKGSQLVCAKVEAPGDVMEQFAENRLRGSSLPATRRG